MSNQPDKLLSTTDDRYVAAPFIVDEYITNLPEKRTGVFYDLFAGSHSITMEVVKRYDPAMVQTYEANKAWVNFFRVIKHAPREFTSILLHYCKDRRAGGRAAISRDSFDEKIPIVHRILNSHHVEDNKKYPVDIEAAVATWLITKSSVTRNLRFRKKLELTVVYDATHSFKLPTLEKIVAYSQLFKNVTINWADLTVPFTRHNIFEKIKSDTSVIPSYGLFMDLPGTHIDSRTSYLYNGEEHMHNTYLALSQYFYELSKFMHGVPVAMSPDNPYLDTFYPLTHYDRQSINVGARGGSRLNTFTLIKTRKA
jgi:site-specific DNA-adenine methylase